LRRTLAPVLPLLLLACHTDKRRKPSTADTAPTHDTGPIPDTDPDCDTGYHDDDGECVPAACGTGTWGDLAVDESTVYVDIAAAAGGDGSEAAPFTSIQAGLDAAADAGAGMVAVAAGTYPETLELDRSHDGVHLAGRCRELVVVDASVGDGSTPGIDVDAKSSEVEVTGVTVSGSQFVGVLVGSGTMTIRDSAVLESEYFGVGAYQARSYSTTLTMEACEIRGNAAVGVAATHSGTSANLRETRIEDTQPDESGDFGYGIHVSEGASLDAEACEVVGNTGSGVLASGEGTSVTLRETSIEDTQTDSNGAGGLGITVSEGANLDAEACVVRGNSTMGVLADDSGTSATLRDTIIEGTQPDAHGNGGYGIEIWGGASLDAETCVVRGNIGAGVAAVHFDTSVTLWETSIEDTQPGENGEDGQGIYVYDGATLCAEACEVSGSSSTGVLAHDSGTSVTLRETRIEGTKPLEDGEDGFGIHIQGGASLDAEACVVRGNTTVGVAASDSDTSVTLRETSIEDTKPLENGEGGYGIEVFGGASLDAEGCVVSGNTAAGLLAVQPGTSVTLWETSIEDTQPDKSGDCGYGIDIYGGASLDAEACEIRANEGDGVAAGGSNTTVTLRETAIENNQRDDNREGGCGINVSDGASLDAEGCEVRGNTAVGVGAAQYGTSVTLRETIIENNQPEENGYFGYGIEVFGEASLVAEACEIRGNTAAGVSAAHSGTSVSLRGGTAIEGTKPDKNGFGGYGIYVSDGASLDAEACELGENTAVGVVAVDSGTSVSLRDTRIASTKRGEVQTVGLGIAAQRLASIMATDIEVSSNEGPGIYLTEENTYLTCSGCVIRDNQFAGALVAWDATLDIADSFIEGTAEQENLGGGVGITQTPGLAALRP